MKLPNLIDKKYKRIYTIKIRSFTIWEKNVKKQLIYISILLASLSILFSPAIIEFFKATSEKQRLASYRAKNLNEIKKEYEMLDQKLKQSPKNPREWPIILSAIEDLQLSCLKQSVISDQSRFREYDRYNVGLKLLRESLFQKYFLKFGYQKLGDATRNYLEKNPLPSPSPTDLSKAWKYLERGYWHSLPIIAVFFIARIYSQGLSFLLEIVTFYRLILAIVFWPIGLFVYPNMDATKQLVKALRFITLILGSSLSCFAAGGTAKKPENTQKKEKTNSSQTANNLSLSHIVVDFIPLTPNGFKKGEISPEYSWKARTSIGNFSGFGFYEWRNQWPWFTNHSINYSPTNNLPLMVSAEQGGGPKGPFFQIGGKAIINRVPILGNQTKKFFDSLVLGRFSKIAGARVPNETLIAWRTKEKETFKGIKIHSEGFYRIRSGNRPDYGQPQVWISNAKLGKFKIGAEIEISGGKFAPIFGIKYVVR